VKPKFENNLWVVIKSQTDTNGVACLTKKETSINEIVEEFLNLILKGYNEQGTNNMEISDSSAYYLNYFLVVNGPKETSSMRIVFDAVAKDRNKNVTEQSNSQDSVQAK
jgi:hypothetical protein